MLLVFVLPLSALIRIPALALHKVEGVGSFQKLFMAGLRRNTAKVSDLSKDISLLVFVSSISVVVCLPLRLPRN